MTESEKQPNRIDEVIHADNYAVVLATGPSTELSFFHTVNFSKNYGCPDLVVFGLNAEQAIDIFDRIFVLHVRPHNGLLRKFGVAEPEDYIPDETSAYFNCDEIDIGSVVPGTTARVLVPTQTPHWKTQEHKWIKYYHEAEKSIVNGRYVNNLRTHNVPNIGWLAERTARPGREAADIKRTTRVAFLDIQGLVDENEKDIITYHPKLLDAFGFTRFGA